jgi:hypothetical protein
MYMLIVMGSTLSGSPDMFIDGDIPREDYPPFMTPGWAYYATSQTGNCSGCGEITSKWAVNIKMTGRWVCDKCSQNKTYPTGPLPRSRS